MSWKAELTDIDYTIDNIIYTIGYLNDKDGKTFFEAYQSARIDLTVEDFLAPIIKDKLEILNKITDQAESGKSLINNTFNEKTSSFTEQAEIIPEDPSFIK